MAFSEEDLALLDLYNFRYDPNRVNPDGKYSTIIGPQDPFIGSFQQTTRMRAYCVVWVNGIDITNKLLPHLISVRVIDATPETSAEIEIDDRDGKMPLPPLNASVMVALGWQTESMIAVFNGVIADFEHGFGRKQGGRRMWVHAKGLSHVNTTAKQPMQDSMGEGAPPGQKEGQLHGLPDWIQQMAKNAGVNAQVDGALASIKQDSWMQASSSLMHTVQQLAETHGLTYQFSEGNKLGVFKKGHRGICCAAVWRDNLIAWRVHPLVMRSSFKGSVGQWFDPQNANWNTQLQKFGMKFPFNTGAANDAPQKSGANETETGNQNQGQQERAEVQQGNGRIIINGEPKAVWDGYVLLTGARPGVDGMYLIEQVEHVYSRQGFITTLEVTPQANAPSSVNVGSAFLDLPKPAPNQG